MLERFYTLFESMYLYIKDLLQFVSDLEDGSYIQYSVDGMLADGDGKQLICEAVYLYGVMLLLMDMKIPGPVRERLIVAHLRYTGTSELYEHTEVCRLCKSSGYSPGGKRPEAWPEELFSRFEIPQQLLRAVIGRLRSDDMYNQRAAFPNPEHRSAAFAGQAAMLYVALFFAPETLQHDRPVMREVVDRYFPDNWVITFYMGYHLDLFEAWAPYKAAMEAMNNTILKDLDIVRLLHAKHVQNLKETFKELSNFLVDGYLTDDLLLDNTKQILDCMRTANVTIRWLMLHRLSENKKLREIMRKSNQDGGISENEILIVLLKASQFEDKVKRMFDELLQNKQTKWNQYKEESVVRMGELADFYSGERQLARQAKDEALQNWFTDMQQKMQELDCLDALKAGRQIQQISVALEEIELYRQVGGNMQVKQFLAESRTYLRHMVRTANISEDTMNTFVSVCDLSYGWEILDSYVPLIHSVIFKEPSRTEAVRTLILKLVSILELPTLRIVQSGNTVDLDGLSEFYSTELVQFVRTVLAVIPDSVFGWLKEIIQVRTGSNFQELPTRVVRSTLKDYAQAESRYKLARSTNEISILTHSVLMMQATLVGCIEIEPKKILEDGIRYELVQQLALTLHQELIFKPKCTLAEFEAQLQSLARRVSIFLQSFEYIQDYIACYGLKLWQEEFSRIIHYNVEQECNRFLKKRVHDWQSKFQSKAIRIPQFKPVDEHSNNFIGRVMRQLMMHIDPRTTVFVGASSSWVDKDGNEVVGMRTFTLLHRSIGTFGIQGLDRLLSFMIVTELRSLEHVYATGLPREARNTLAELSKILTPVCGLPNTTEDIYERACKRTRDHWSVFVTMMTKIGTMQLIRCQIVNELNLTSKCDSNTLSCTNAVFNQALLNDVRAHYNDPEAAANPGESSELLADFTKYLEATGFNHPSSKIYVTMRPFESLPIFLFLLVLAQMHKFTYSRKFGVLTCTDKKEMLDGVPFLMGIITVLKQLHSSYTHTFLAYLGQFVRFQISNQEHHGYKSPELSQMVINVLIFLEDFCKYGHFSRKVVEGYIPPYIFDQFKHDNVK
eukprot:TRINITY_DN10622_c0_g4_i2.p1 TRINITY_DN10622_c0_g4~~TRINITY_DN10622_c0_g4_i2.p1  ORF type:complete len:1069 (-),score=421.60 TRINITY_DN10622_c0_g4_i2:243-3449(-)